MKWFVGQRVKVVYVRRIGDGGDPTGKQGTIAEIKNFARGDVLADGFEFPLPAECLVITDAGYEFYPLFDQLVPLYDGHEKIEWEEMKDLWHPSNIEEVAQVS